MFVLRVLKLQLLTCLTQLKLKQVCTSSGNLTPNDAVLQVERDIRGSLWHKGRRYRTCCNFADDEDLLTIIILYVM